LFEAGACGTPVISDVWNGLDELFQPGTEIILAETADDVTCALRRTSEAERRAIGAAARRRVLAEHTAEHRAAALESLLLEAMASRSRKLVSL
jgi:spore maturation protein CgeB